MIILKCEEKKSSRAEGSPERSLMTSITSLKTMAETRPAHAKLRRELFRASSIRSREWRLIPSA